MLFNYGLMWRSKWLWIDQICIDQSNLSEKAVQVSNMFDIYRQAVRVVAYLGCPPLSGYAVGMLIELMVLSQREPNAFDLLQLNNVPVAGLMWRGLVEFLENPWFTRVWIIQAIAAARKIKMVYGRYSLDWDSVGSSLEILLRTGFRDKIEVLSEVQAALHHLSLLHEIQFIRENKNRAGGVLTHTIHKLSVLGKLPYLLCNTARFEATDPRDKIFAVQSLTQSKDLHVTPDYTAPVEAIFTDLAYTILTEFCEPFCTMAFAEVAPSKKTNLPSWMPDWSRLDPRHGFNINRKTDVIGPLINTIMERSFPGSGEEHQKVGYAASGDTTPEFIKVIGSRKSILIRGLMVDRVHLLGSCDLPDAKANDRFIDKNGFYLKTTHSKMIYDWFHEAHAMAMRLADHPLWTRQQLEEAFWRTLIGDIAGERRPAPATVREDYSAWVHTVNAHRRIYHFLEQGQSDVCLPRDEFYLRCLGRSSAFSQAMIVTSPDRRFMVTEGGGIGIAPLESHVGDMVFLPLGASTPWVLQRVEKSEIESAGVGEDFLFVGECYVHGMMDGEIMEMCYSTTEGDRVSDSGTQDPNLVHPSSRTQDILPTIWVRLN